jgi:hypothetical protein
MESYAGVDWASDKHDVLVADAAGEKLLAATFAHDESGLRSLCRQLVRLKVALVAVERPDGLLVERLLDAGLRVLALHPNQVAAARDRFRVSGGKSDRFDAFVLCELARTDHHRFRGAGARLRSDQGAQSADPRAGRPGRDAHRAVKPAPGRAGAVLARAASPVQRSAQPDLAGVPGALPEPSRHARAGRGAPGRIPGARALLRRADTRAAARQAQTRARRSRRHELATRRQLVLTHVSMIKLVGEQIKELERQIATSIREHPDGAIFLSPFKGSVITAAELLGEIGDCRGRYPTRDTVAGDAGQAAVAKESGKRKTATFRWGCNKRLRQAFHTLADSSRHHNPWAQDLYADARARGHDHPRALRTVGRAWSRIVWRCL